MNYFVYRIKLEAQVNTWASHIDIRNYWGFTQLQDYDIDCDFASDENVAHLQAHVQMCQESTQYPNEQIRSFVKPHYTRIGETTYRKDPGWLCAQRRLGRALGWISYKYTTVTIPDILIIVDDDTFVDIDRVKHFMTRMSRSSGQQPLVGAGKVWKGSVLYPFPHGGLGTFFNKEAIQNMVKPVFCPLKGYGIACKNVQYDRLLETEVFREGDSVFDLFYKISAQRNFCLHSDWLMGYMIKFYLEKEVGMSILEPPGNSIEKCTMGQSTTCHWQAPSDMEQLTKESSLLVVDLPNGHEKTAATSVHMMNITFSASGVIERLSPPERVNEENVIQLDDEFMILIGGFTNGYNSASRSIQFFHIPTQKWKPQRRLDLPPGIGDTHQGTTFDPVTRILYIVSGQLGGACKPATTAVAQIHVDSGKYKMLLPLPAARYSPGTAILSDQGVKYLHVFGGASEMRNTSSTDHWRLTLTGKDKGSMGWQELENVPDGGGHGTSFAHDGYIYYTAFSTMDQGVSLADTMQGCQKTATGNGQILHHSSDVGLFYRYSSR